MGQAGARGRHPRELAWCWNPDEALLVKLVAGPASGAGRGYRAQPGQQGAPSRRAFTAFVGVDCRNSGNWFAARVCGELLPALAAARGIVSAVYADRNAAITQASSAAADRAGDRYLEAVIAVETSCEAGADAAVAALQPPHLARLGGGAHWIAAPCVLRLMVALPAPPVAARAT